MTRRRARALVVFLTIAIAYGCVLPSFERTPAENEPQGGESGTAGSSGSSGSATGGMPPGGQGPMGGEGGAPGGDGGAAGTPDLISVYKQYVVEQGTNLGVPASQGLFVYAGAEDRDWTSVTRSTRDLSLPSDIATLDIDPNDGSFTFEPAAELFGVYHATYELGNAADETATGDLYITVQPVAVDLADVVNDVGGFTVTGFGAEGIGKAVAGAGDVDGDGFDDFLVGAPANTGDPGRVFVVFGGSELESFELSPSSGARHTVIEGSESEQLGMSVSAAGDLDGDGLGDFLIGAPGEPGAAGGQAYVVFGRARGELSGAIADVVSAGGFTLSRPSSSENVGALVAGGDDLTGDDVPDLVVFAVSSATFYVVDGTASSDVDLATESEVVFRTTPTLDTADFRGLSLLGDVSDDDTGELMVGTGSLVALLAGPASGFPTTLTGTFPSANGVRVGPAGYGFVAVSRAANFDDEGTRDSAFCRQQNAANDRCRIFLDMPGSDTDGVSVTGFGMGQVRVAGGGDTSGDAFADLLFSETDVNAPASSAWVIFGRGRSQLGSPLNVQNLGVRGFSISGGSDIEAVTLGGDIDGPARDGSSTADWLVGDTAAAGGNGRVSVIFGGEFSR